MGEGGIFRLQQFVCCKRIVGTGMVRVWRFGWIGSGSTWRALHDLRFLLDGQKVQLTVFKLCSTKAECMKGATCLVGAEVFMTGILNLFNKFVSHYSDRKAKHDHVQKYHLVALLICSICSRAIAMERQRVSNRLQDCCQPERMYQKSRIPPIS